MLFYAVKQFPVGHDRNHRFTWWQSSEVSNHILRPPLAQIYAGIRVEQIACCHQSPLRRWGFRLSFTEESIGSSARISRTRSIVPFFSLKTISSPRREISSSLLLTRNFFGNRTAWLFPDLNTRATVNVRTLLYILAVYTSVHTMSRRSSGGLCLLRSGVLATSGPRRSHLPAVQ